MSDHSASGIASGLKFPEALTRSPRCFIALSGLDVLNNAVHRAVWDEFTTGGRRTERKPILYKNVPADHLYPKCCVHRTSYEDHIPLGILKVGWLHKHTQLLPALVVFFFDLDWSDPQWEEKQTECVSKIQVIRSTLQGRATEIVIVLLQTTPPMPVGEASNVAGERAAALCASCELPRLNLFVLPFTHRPQGFITKIEEAFYKKALQYYGSQIQTVRSHKEMLNKQLHQLLLIRHQFKIAFYTEMKQDTHGALKLYRAAYSHLVESMYLTEDRIVEFKLVAGFLIYKICRLCFEADEPLHAIGQFQRHVDRFSGERGSRQLVYEHSEWMARQFSAFADLFSEAVKRGLKAIQTQNPGLYYHQAALYARERKLLSRKLCQESSQAASQQLMVLPEPTYYGHRPWRKDLRDDQPSNMDLRQKCIVAMQAAELSVEHSWQIIPLLTKAISHFKNYHSERMITSLKVLMGQEYYHVKDYEKSLVLLQGVTEAYRHEQWWTILASVLKTIFFCSYLLGCMQDYFTAAMELTSRYIPLPVDEKQRIQQNIAAVFSGHPPSPEPGVDAGAQEKANQLWTGLLQGEEPREFMVQASSHASCIECKTAFSHSSFCADSPIEICVHLRSSAPLPIHLSKLTVLFHQETYNTCCVVSERMELQPNIVRSFTFSFPVTQSTVRDTLEVQAVEALFGQEGECSSRLVWNNGVSESFSSKPGDLVWQKLDTCTSTYIQPRLPAVSISLLHNAPALTSEYYSIKLSVQNTEERPISNLQVGVALPDSLDETQPAAELYDTIPGSLSDQKQKQTLDLAAGELASGAKFETLVFLCSHGVSMRKLDVAVTYDVTCEVLSGRDPVVCSCQQEDSIMIQTVKPFDVTYKLMNKKFKVIDTIGFDEPFILMTEIFCTSPWQLLIVGSHFNPPKNVTDVSLTNSQIEGLELGTQDHASECRCMLAARQSGQQTSVSLGTYTIQWRRLSDSHSTVLTSTVTFPSIPARSLPFTITADIPASGTLQEVLPVSYVIHNHTLLVQEFEVRIGTSDTFMYSGQRLCRFRVLPSSSHTLTYNLYPVATGLMPLPHLDLSYQRDPKFNEYLVHSTLPTTIFIKPSSISREVDSETVSPVPT